MYIKKSYIKIFMGVHYVSSVGVEDVLSFYHRTVINTICVQNQTRYTLLIFTSVLRISFIDWHCLLTTNMDYIVWVYVFRYEYICIYRIYLLLHVLLYCNLHANTHKYDMNKTLVTFCCFTCSCFWLNCVWQPFWRIISHKQFTIIP